MKKMVIVISVLFVLTPILASAEVWIPEDEFYGYFDSNDIYTVVGAVRNTEDYSVLPTIKITINENGKITTVNQDLPVVFPHRDIPFKLKVPQITNKDVVLEKPNVSFEKTNKLATNVAVIYDKTLKKHEDGHLTGRIINQGNNTEYDIKVYATIHGKNNKFLDVGKNIEKISKVEPGQIIEFSLYPDPLFAEQVNYYSCFAIGDETIIPLYALRNGERFNFRYDSTASFTVVGFNELGTELTLNGINSFKVKTYVNFEFPKTSEDEEFQILVDGKQTEFIQSIDEEGNWHVAFDVDGASQNKIVIDGFKRAAALPVVEKSVEKSTDYSFIYYVGAVVIAAGVGVSVYKYRNKKKLTT
jgi:hypothetical protein